MIRLSLPLIGPALGLLPSLRVQARRKDRFANLLHGLPGTGKSHLLDLLALEITDGSPHAIETVNGQSLDIAVVRQWRTRGCSGNLFAKWTIKRIDEIDKASDAAQAELLTWLDYLPPHYAVLATTNDYRGLCRRDGGRLQRRFAQHEVAAPSLDEAAAYLAAQFHLAPDHARAIATGATYSADLFAGVNMGAAVEDTLAYLDALEAQQAA